MKTRIQTGKNEYIPKYEGTEKSKVRHCRKCETKLSQDRYFNCKSCVPTTIDIDDSFVELPNNISVEN